MICFLGKNNVVGEGIFFGEGQNFVGEGAKNFRWKKSGIRWFTFLKMGVSVNICTICT